jgi:sorting nexin-25
LFCTTTHDPTIDQPRVRPPVDHAGQGSACEMNGQPIPAISKRVKVGAALVAVLALACPRLSFVQTVLLTPAFLAVGCILLVTATIVTAARCEASSGRPKLSHRQSQALRRFNFTTSSAWSAVLTRQTWEESPSPTWRIPVRHLQTKSAIARLDAIFDLIKANFISPWYARISPSHAFPDAIEALIRQCLSGAIHQGEQVDWPDVLISRITPLLTAHLQHYRTIEHLSLTLATPHNSLPLPLPRISPEPCEEDARPHPARSPTHRGSLRDIDRSGAGHHSLASV